MAALMLALVACWTAAASTPTPWPSRGPKNLPPPEHVFELPEDYGPAAIDVTDYPPEHQATYRDIFLPVYAILRGGPKRAINSPLLELDPNAEAALRREHPELFARDGLVEVSPDAWKKEVTRIKNRPPCCGACPQLTMEQARALWRFLAYDSLRRKTGPNAAAWAEHRKQLLAQHAARRDQNP